MEPIGAVARSLGIEPRRLSLYGDDVAKVSLDAMRPGAPHGKLVVVTGVTPTPAGEGKTTIAVGLVQALAKLGHKAAATLPEPSLGAAFGPNGSGTGGGRSRIVPENDIALHFTGDAHAVSAAHNLLAAFTEDAVARGQVPGLSAGGIVWRRVSPVVDPALRQVATGLGGAGNGPVRDTGFDLPDASEIMSEMALAASYDDLRRRLNATTVGYKGDGQPVRAQDVGAVGPMMALLRRALLPNLVQTLEGQPAFVHTGPACDVAHGSSSVLADRIALGYADYVVTEAGGGADLGFEKFMHIKARSSGLRPSAAVLVVTARAMKSHGGAPPGALTLPDPFAVQLGAANLRHAVGLVKAFGLPVVVAVNRFPTDTPQELVIIQDAAIAAGASAAVTCTAFADGGDGAMELAEAVLRASSGPGPKLEYLYAEDAPVREKVRILATRVYGAASVRWAPAAEQQLDAFEKLGMNNLPVCIAKTPLSLSHDPSLKGAPTGYAFEISGVRAATGAGFVCPIARDVVTMPGLPEKPRTIDIGPSGEVTGL